MKNKSQGYCIVRATCTPRISARKQNSGRCTLVENGSSVVSSGQRKGCLEKGWNGSIWLHMGEEERPSLTHKASLRISWKQLRTICKASLLLSLTHMKMTCPFVLNTVKLQAVDRQTLGNISRIKICMYGELYLFFFLIQKNTPFLSLGSLYLTHVSYFSLLSSIQDGRVVVAHSELAYRLSYLFWKPANYGVTSREAGRFHLIVVAALHDEVESCAPLSSWGLSIVCIGTVQCQRWCGPSYRCDFSISCPGQPKAHFSRVLCSLVYVAIYTLNTYSFGANIFLN